MIRERWSCRILYPVTQWPFAFEACELEACPAESPLLYASQAKIDCQNSKVGK